jgi:anti-sigma factor RsiW
MSGGPDLVAALPEIDVAGGAPQRLVAGHQCVPGRRRKPVPSHLVLIGAAQAVLAPVFEVPAGVVADTTSRAPEEASGSAAVLFVAASRCR